LEFSGTDNGRFEERVRSVLPPAEPQPGAELALLRNRIGDAADDKTEALSILGRSSGGFVESLPESVCTLPGEKT
jgi:hypothetical protein